MGSIRYNTTDYYTIPGPNDSHIPPVEGWIPCSELDDNPWSIGVAPAPKVEFFVEDYMVKQAAVGHFLSDISQVDIDEDALESASSCQQSDQQEGRFVENQQILMHLNEDLHNFQDATGFWTSDWVLKVTVKQHDGKDDEEGKRIEISRVQKAHNYRLYTVDANQLIKVTVKNLSTKTAVKFIPSYLPADFPQGDEEPEDEALLTSGGGHYEMPYPLEKDEGEEEDAWAIRDENGRIILKLRFALE